MINTLNLRLMRHYGVFGDGFCNCHLCRDARLVYQKRMRRIKQIVFILFSAVIIIILSCKLARAENLHASYYSEASLKKEGTWSTSHGVMANGHKFNDNALTCATRLYPLGTHLLITNLNNNKSVLVIVTDRVGRRFAKTRIDLSQRAFMDIAELRQGLVPISVTKINITIKKG